MKNQIVAIPNGPKLLFVKSGDILYCCSEGSYTSIYLSNGRKITISKHLKEVEASINNKNFVRIHNSHLINIYHAVSFMNNSYNCITMSNGEELSVARSRKKELMNYFTKL